jgi:hypothetical protein
MTEPIPTYISGAVASRRQRANVDWRVKLVRRVENLTDAGIYEMTLVVHENGERSLAVRSVVKLECLGK